MSLNDYLKEHGFTQLEGNSNEVPEQQKDLMKLTANVVHIMEIGFNAGHSADLILKNNPKAQLVSFDLGCHDYVLVAKEYIDKTYPGRHRLILGDSRSSVKNFIKENPNQIFQVIFIDGGHEYSIAQADLNNCKRLAVRDTLVLMDDVIYNPGWFHQHTYGPSQVWQEARTNKVVSEISHTDYMPGRGMAWGRYVL